MYNQLARTFIYLYKNNDTKENKIEENSFNQNKYKYTKLGKDCNQD